MKVRELIEQLQTQEPEREVIYWHIGGETRA